MKKLTVNHFAMCMAACCLILTSCSKTEENLIPSEGPAITKSTDTTGFVPEEEDFYYIGSWEGAGVTAGFDYYSWSSTPPALVNPVVTIVDPLTDTSIKSLDRLTYWGTYPVGNGLYRHSFSINIWFRANYGNRPLEGVHRFTFAGFGYFDLKFIQDEWNG